MRLGFPTSNNEEEYETLLAGLRMLKQIGAERVQLYCDLQLVVSQVIREFEVKNQRMMSYLKEVEIMKCQFKKIEISHIT